MPGGRGSRRARHGIRKRRRAAARPEPSPAGEPPAAAEPPSAPAAPAPSGWSLRWLDPTTAGQRSIPLAASLTLGRHPDNDVVLASGDVSGHHARIEAQGEEFVVVDL